MFSPRGSIVATTLRVVEYDNGSRSSSLRPRILCQVKTGSRNMRDAWFKECRHKGLIATEVDSAGDWVTWYDVCGELDALEALCNNPPKCLIDWQYVMNVRTPRGIHQPSVHGLPLPPSEKRLDQIAAARKILRDDCLDEPKPARKPRWHGDKMPKSVTTPPDVVHTQGINPIPADDNRWHANDSLIPVSAPADYPAWNEAAWSVAHMPEFKGGEGI